MAPSNRGAVEDHIWEIFTRTMLGSTKPLLGKEGLTTAGPVQLSRLRREGARWRSAFGCPCQPASGTAHCLHARISSFSEAGWVRLALREATHLVWRHPESKGHDRGVFDFVHQIRSMPAEVPRPSSDIELIDTRALHDLGATGAFARSRSGAPVDSESTPAASSHIRPPLASTSAKSSRPWRRGTFIVRTAE